MLRSLLIALVLIGGMLSASATTANAHPKLVKTDPAADTDGRRTRPLAHVGHHCDLRHPHPDSCRMKPRRVNPRARHPTKFRSQRAPGTPCLSQRQSLGFDGTRA